MTCCSRDSVGRQHLIAALCRSLPWRDVRDALIERAHPIKVINELVRPASWLAVLQLQQQQPHRRGASDCEKRTLGSILSGSGKCSYFSNLVVILCGRCICYLYSSVIVRSPYTLALALAVLPTTRSIYRSHIVYNTLVHSKATFIYSYYYYSP